jgi:hypothetical protein
MAPTPAPGQIITFYSYKGGTGRSMALANVGYLLAGQLPENSRGILMIDWDLEAPGLHRYFEDSFKRSFPRSSDRSGPFTLHPGLIDFFTEADSRYKKVVLDPGSRDAGDLNEAEREKVRSEAFAGFQRFVVATDYDHLAILKAGRFDADYAERIRTFDWERFHHQDPGFFRAFRHFLMERYEYVLIDSRTGLTDTSGICVQQMPEKLVLVFAPNRQNIEGVLDVARRVRRFRVGSSDLRPLVSFPLASRIDGQNERLRETWRHGGRSDDEKVIGYQRTFEDLFKELYDLDECDLGTYFDATQVKHDADYAYGERIAARRGTTDQLSLGRTFADFTRRLTTLAAPWELLPEERELEDARRREQVATAKEIDARRQTRAFLAVAVVSASVAIITAMLAWFFPFPKSHAQEVLAAARAASDPLEKALLLAELADSSAPSGGIELARQVASAPIPLTVLRGHAAAVIDVAFSPDGSRIATASLDQTTRLWKLDGAYAARELGVARGGSRPICVAWSPAGNTVLTGYANGAIRILDRFGELSFYFETEDQLLAATFDSYGMVYTVSPRREQLWELNQTGVRLHSAQQRAWPFVARYARYGELGGFLAIAGLETLVYRSGDSKGLDVGPPALAMAFSADDRYLMTSTETDLSLWGLTGDWYNPDYTRVWQERNRGPGGTSVEFGPKNRFLAVGRDDGTVQVFVQRWRGESKRFPLASFEFRGHRGPVRALAFSSDDTLLATASADSTVRLWHLDKAEPPADLEWPALLKYIRDRTTACLTGEQRMQLLSETAEEAREKYSTCERKFGRSGALSPDPDPG